MAQKRLDSLNQLEHLLSQGKISTHPANNWINLHCHFNSTTERNDYYIKVAKDHDIRTNDRNK